MDIDQALDAGREALVLAFTVAAPILAIGLVVGLVIALVQAVTQLHEQTLTFVPKILAMAGAAVFFIPWIASRMLEYAVTMFGESPW